MELQAKLSTKAQNCAQGLGAVEKQGNADIWWVNRTNRKHQPIAVYMMDFTANVDNL